MSNALSVQNNLMGEAADWKRSPRFSLVVTFYF